MAVPDIDNDDPTTWHKESGVIAQELYYDAPELRHLIHKGKPDLDEEGNGIPLPSERPTFLLMSVSANGARLHQAWGLHH